MATTASPLSGQVPNTGATVSATNAPAATLTTSTPGAEAPPNVLRQRKGASGDSDAYRADDEAGEDDSKLKDKTEVTWGKTPSGQGELSIKSCEGLVLAWNSNN